MSDSPTLPRADDAERYCLGCLIAFPDTAGELFELLQPTDFFDVEHQRIFTAAARQFSAGGIDRVLLGKETKQPKFLVDLGISPHNAPVTDAHIPTEAAKIVEARRKRQLFAIADDARHAALNGHSFATALRLLNADLEDLGTDSRTAIDLPKVSTLNSRPVDWAWNQFLHRGGLTLLDGDPEKGKSQITCDVAARWSYPRPFPFTVGDDFRDPGNVLMIAPEDNAETTIRPRLEAACANLDRVHLWPESEDPITFPSGVGTLAAAVDRYEISLIIIDPLPAHLDENINANRDADVRRALRPLAAMAQEKNLALLGTRHLNKDESKSALYRGGGSIAFTAAARVVWAVGIDPNDSKRMVLAVLKSNIAIKPPALTYSIEGVGTTSRIRWEGESTCTAGEIFGRRSGGGRNGMKTSGAERLLADLLADGQRPEAEVRQACLDAGIGEWAYRNARRKLGITSTKGSMREGWLLSLPEDGGEAEGEADEC